MKNQLIKLFGGIIIGIVFIVGVIVLATSCVQNDPFPSEPQQPKQQNACGTGWSNLGKYTNASSCKSDCAYYGGTMWTYLTDGSQICCCF